MTLYKRSADLLQQLKDQLASISTAAEAPTALQQEQAVEDIAATADRLAADVAKMKAKADERDPEKQVYGKGMVDKILRLAADQEALTADIAARTAQLQPLAAAERQRQAAAEEAARQEQEAEQRWQQEAAAETLRQQEEAAERQRQAEEAERAELARQAEAAKQKRRDEEAAAAEAKRQQAAAAAAEAKRQAELQKAEQEKKRAEEQAKKQGAERAAAAAATAAQRSKPLVNPGGELVHLRNGKSELDDILSRAGDRQLVVLDYSASWCGPCRMMEPVLTGWGRELAPRIVFIKCDCEATPANQALARTNQIRAYPTFHVYRNSQVVSQVQGADRGRLRSAIDSEARLLAPIESGPAERPAMLLAKAMSDMKRRVSPAAFQSAAELLLAYVRNLVNKPEEEKYRRIKSSNARFKAALGSQPHGRDCMLALGFRSHMEAADEVWVLESASPELLQVKTLLEQAMALGAASASRSATGGVAGAGADAPTAAVPVTPAPATAAAATPSRPAATPAPVPVPGSAAVACAAAAAAAAAGSVAATPAPQPAAAAAATPAPGGVDATPVAAQSFATPQVPAAPQRNVARPSLSTGQRPPPPRFNTSDTPESGLPQLLAAQLAQILSSGLGNLSANAAAATTAAQATTPAATVPGEVASAQPDAGAEPSAAEEEEIERALRESMEEDGSRQE